MWTQTTLTKSECAHTCTSHLQEARCDLPCAHSPSWSVPPDLTQQEPCPIVTSPGSASTRSWDFQRCRQDRQMTALRYCLSSFSEFGDVLSTNNMSLLLPALPNHWSCRQASCVCFLSFIINTMASQVLIPASYLLVTTKTGKKGKADFWQAVGIQKCRFG